MTALWSKVLRPMSLFGFGLAAVSAYGACSSSDSGGSSLQSAGGNTGSGATSGKGGSSGTSTGSGGSAGTISVAGGTGPGSGGTSTVVPDACAAVHNTAQPTPVDLFIMLDQSTSMAEAAGNGQTKWQAVVAAIKAFVASPQATGIGVGIQYFGLSAPCPSTCTATACALGSTDWTCNTSCPVAQYATPDVPISPLPNVATFINGSLDSHYPSSFTPTAPALQGALQYAGTWATANPTRTTIVVLATDGYPTQCQPQDPSGIAQIAAAALTAANKVYTFVIGIVPTSSPTWNLDTIAAGGGTRKAFIIDPSSATIVQDFTNALLGVATAPLSCEYPIPKPDGGTIDPGKVNVEFTPLTGSPVDLYGVKTAQDCSKVANGWYYDNPTAPTTILICPSTCNSFGAGTLDILLGCATTPPPA